MTTTDASLITSMSVREHFRDALETATHNQEVELGDMTFVYVVNLLTEYCHSRALSAVSDESRHIKPLALIYAQALDAPLPEHRNRALQKLGDVDESHGGRGAEGRGFWTHIHARHGRHGRRHGRHDVSQFHSDLSRAEPRFGGVLFFYRMK